MMIKGGIRIGGLSRISGFDGDAAAYFDRAGVTDATAKQQINAFVVGVKALGLWNNMVCWPLRSAQNKGSGTTAYSLGGYGTYNGTLSSSALWGSNGLSISSASEYISTSITLNAYPDSFIEVINQTTTAGADLYTSGVNVSGRQFVYGSSGDPTTDLLYLTRDTWVNYATGAIYLTHGYSTRVGVRYVSFRPQNNTSVNCTVNNSTGTGAVNGWAASSSSTITPRGLNGLIITSFLAYTNSAISDSLDLSIRSLYKTTLGTGLGLP
jgi:hypothetical protein